MTPSTITPVLEYACVEHSVLVVPQSGWGWLPAPPPLIALAPGFPPLPGQVASLEEQLHDTVVQLQAAQCHSSQLEQKVWHMDADLAAAQQQLESSVAQLEQSRREVLQLQGELRGMERQSEHVVLQVNQASSHVRHLPRTHDCGGCPKDA